MILQPPSAAFSLEGCVTDLTSVMREPNITATHHLANALFRALKMGFLFDLANPLGIPQAPLKSIAGARIKQQGGSKYDPVNKRLLVFAHPFKRAGISAMTVYLDLEGFEKIYGNMPLELRSPFWAAVKAPIGEVYEWAGGVFVPNRFHRKGKAYLDAREAPEAYEWLAQQCFAYGLVQRTIVVEEVASSTQKE
jgi:hypothetical protein